METSVVSPATYFELDLNSYSRLKDFAYHPLYYKKKYIDKVIKPKSNKSLDLGSLTDFMLTSNDAFEDVYHVLEQDITDSIYLICEYIKENIKNGSLKHINNQVLMDTIRELSLYNNIKKDETLISKIESIKLLNTVSSYVTIQKDFIVNPSLYKEACDLANKVLTSPLIGYFFSDNYLQEQDIEYHNQFIHLFTYRGLPLKIMVDKCFINHHDKKIHGMDIKTMQGNTAMFSRNYYKYRYDIQGFIYYMGLDDFRKRYHPSYELEDFSFLVVSTTDHLYPPTIFDMKQEHRAKAQNGVVSNHNFYEGVDELIDNLLWSMDNNLWEYTREQYENKGKQKLIV